MKLDLLKFLRDKLAPLPILIGLVIALLVTAYLVYQAPADYLQGSLFKIIYLHVPTAWFALAIFAMIAGFSGLFLITKSPSWNLLAQALAPIGLLYTAIALFSGAIWGKPAWGTYWVWDARLTSMLFQLFIYFGYIALAYIYTNPIVRSHALAYYALVGMLNLPIIKFSVYLWNTLHQKSTIITLSGPKIATEMFVPLIFAFLTLLLYTLLMLNLNLRITKLMTKLSKRTI